jgi:tRNA A-37 threonylcarbamoyl transferase component Bud32
MTQPSRSGWPPTLAEALSGRYVLERALGAGGTATVYLAQDLKHRRPVALKVLRAELGAALGPERFTREIEIAARLQHPHILAVFDSGEAAGQLWFTMPFVEGESLRDRLRRVRQIPLEEAVRIAREVAAALDYAHRQGILHRDIKPENILLTAEGEALVADFGIARALEAGDEALTRTGLSVGTPAYMSPEQAAGERSLDARSDVYALGAVVYEMLAGEPPFTGPTAQAILARRFTETPRPLRTVRQMIPPAVDDAVARALARAAADRFGSAGEFAAALASDAAQQPSAATIPVPVTSPARRRHAVPVTLLALVLGFAIGLGVLFAWRRDRDETGDAKAGVVRVAVLPFDNLGNSADAYFADGVEVNLALGRLSDALRHAEWLQHGVARHVGLGLLVAVHARAGDTAAARVLLGELVKRAPADTMAHAWVRVLAYAAVGERDSAFAWLERRRRSRFLSPAAFSYPLLDPLRADPRFAELERRVRLDTRARLGRP